MSVSLTSTRLSSVSVTSSAGFLTRVSCLLICTGRGSNKGFSNSPMRFGFPHWHAVEQIHTPSTLGLGTCRHVIRAMHERVQLCQTEVASIARALASVESTTSSDTRSHLQEKEGRSKDSFQDLLRTARNKPHSAPANEDLGTKEQWMLHLRHCTHTADSRHDSRRSNSQTLARPTAGPTGPFN